MNSIITELIDILHYDKKKGKRVYLKDCHLLADFMFARHDFYLAEKNGYYWVCVLKDKEAYCVWLHKIEDEEGKHPYNEIMSKFRKEYLKHNITDEDINSFIENPIEYKKKKGLK